MILQPWTIQLHQVYTHSSCLISLTVRLTVATSSFDSLATHGIHPESSNSVIEDPYNCNSDEVEKDDKYNEYNASVPLLHLEEENLESSDGSEGESRDEHLSDEGV